jgi:transcriptional regulator with XRE-family HTH domain
MSSPAARLREARSRAGLPVPEAAAAAGISANELADLESDDDEVTTAVSLRALRALCRAVGMSLRDLFDPGHEAPASAPVSPDQLVARLRQVVRERGLTLNQLEDHLGVIIEPLLDDPAYLLTYNVDTLRAICDATGIDWRTALPE